MGHFSINVPGLLAFSIVYGGISGGKMKQLTIALYED
jgi:hypothetical protein